MGHSASSQPVRFVKYVGLGPYFPGSASRNPQAAPVSLHRPAALIEDRLGASVGEKPFQLRSHLSFSGCEGLWALCCPPPSGPMAPAHACPVSQPRPGCFAGEGSLLASSCPQQGC